MAKGRLESDPLFLGLTRPPLVLGVTYIWFLLNMVVWIVVFIQTSSFKHVFIGFPLVHAIGFFICSKEPRFMDIVMIKAGKCSRCRNSSYHGNTDSYDLF